MSFGDDDARAIEEADALAALTREAQARGEYGAVDVNLDFTVHMLRWLVMAMSTGLDPTTAERTRVGDAARQAVRVLASHGTHGRGGAEDGPEESDCACRGTPARSACAYAGCGFCLAAPVRDAAGTGTDGVTDEDVKRALDAYWAAAPIGMVTPASVRVILEADRARAGGRP